MAKKRILREFKLNEISMVDRPAQEGAVATIMKRDHSEDLEKAVIALTSSNNNHQHGIIVRGYDEYMIGVSYSGADGESKHEHEVVYRDGEFIVSENMGHSHTIAPEDAVKIQAEINRLRMKNSEQSDMVNEATSQAPLYAVKTANLEETQMTEKADNATAKGDGPSMNGVISLLRRVANMSDDQLKSLKMMDDDKMGKCLSGDLDIVEAVDAIAKSDPVVFEDGETVVRKSDGELALNLAKSRKADRDQLQALSKAAKDADLQKRATETMNHFGGELAGKVALLKAVDALESDEKDAALAVIKVQDDELAKNFKEVGAGSDVEKADNSENANDELDRLAKAHSDKEGVNYYQAYDVVVSANPELYKKAMEA